MCYLSNVSVYSIPTQSPRRIPTQSLKLLEFRESKAWNSGYCNAYGRDATV